MQPGLQSLAPLSCISKPHVEFDVESPSNSCMAFAPDLVAHAHLSKWRYRFPFATTCLALTIDLPLIVPLNFEPLTLAQRLFVFLCASSSDFLLGGSQFIYRSSIDMCWLASTVLSLIAPVKFEPSISETPSDEFSVSLSVSSDQAVSVGEAAEGLGRACWTVESALSRRTSSSILLGLLLLGRFCPAES